MVLVPRPGSALTISQEKKMGERFFLTVRKQLPLIADPVLNRYYNNIGQSLVKHLEKIYYPYHFFIIDDPTLNAFSGPGGYVFMYRGLFLIFDREDELAAVTAHEIGHVVNRHIAKRLERNKRLSLAAMVGMLAGGFLGGVNPSLATGVMTTSMAATMAMELKYSRQDEEQADRTGVNLLIKSGYDAWAMVSAFKKLARFSLSSGGTIPAYLKTHPGVEDRIVYVSSALKNMGIRHKSRNQMRFKLMQARLRALYTDREAATDYFQLLQKTHPKSPVPYYGLGLCLMQEGDYKNALSEFNRALLYAPNNIFLKREIGICYAKAARFKKAIFYLEGVPMDVEVGLHLGWAFQGLGQAKKATRIWEMVVKNLNFEQCLDKEVYERIYYYLGQNYASEKRLDWAHYYLGMYFKLKGEISMAQYHFKKAISLTHDSRLEKMISKERK